MDAQAVISKGQAYLNDDPYYIVRFSEHRERNAVPYVTVDIATIKGHIRSDVGSVVIGLANNRLSVTVMDDKGDERITTWFPEEPDFGPHAVTESDTAEEVICPPSSTMSPTP